MFKYVPTNYDTSMLSELTPNSWRSLHIHNKYLPDHVHQRAKHGIRQTWLSATDDLHHRHASGIHSASTKF
jgi:hypothetical protein